MYYYSHIRFQMKQKNIIHSTAKVKNQKCRLNLNSQNILYNKLSSVCSVNSHF